MNRWSMATFAPGCAINSTSTGAQITSPPSICARPSNAAVPSEEGSPDQSAEMTLVSIAVPSPRLLPRSRRFSCNARLLFPAHLVHPRVDLLHVPGRCAGEDSGVRLKRIPAGTSAPDNDPSFFEHELNPIAGFQPKADTDLLRYSDLALAADGAGIRHFLTKTSDSKDIRRLYRQNRKLVAPGAFPTRTCDPDHGGGGHSPEINEPLAKALGCAGTERSAREAKRCKEKRAFNC